MSFGGIFLLSAFCLLPSVFAQPGGVKGKVRNMRGDSIAGASITARQNDNDVRSVTSNNKGEFLLQGLEAGLYNIVFEAKGYSQGSFRNKVEIKKGKVIDLGGNLILQADRGTLVIVNGSVYYKDGTSLAGAKVEVERLNSDGSGRKISTGYTSDSGEFTFRQPEGKAKFRITATHQGVTGTKEVEVDNAAIYRLSIILEIERPKSN